MIQQHQQRVIDERLELADKISKLTIFILGLGSDAFKTLQNEEQWDLRDQLEKMWEYHRILERRIQRFIEDDKPVQI